MLLFVTHHTRVSYSEPIAETVMQLRMTPLTNRHQTLRGNHVSVGPAATLVAHRDWLGNHVHQFSVLPPHESVVILAQSGVDTHPRHPELTAVQDRRPFTLPLEARHFTRFGGLIPEDPRLAALATRCGATGDAPVGQILERVTTGLLDEIAYRKGVTTSRTTLTRALDEQAGVCQDLAHIAIGILRHVGIPARYVSGYLYRESGSEELETHAWCEAWTPSTGWLALDPTHRQVGGECHIAVAIGRDFSDVPPNRGVYQGQAEERIEVQVTIRPSEELPDGLLVPRVTDVGLSDVTLPAREALDYQQEQRQQQQ